MPARFKEPVELTANTPLTDLQRARLAVVGPLYFGGKGAAKLAGPGFNDDPMESRTLMFCVEHKVVDGDQHLYDLWSYMGDSGTFFRAGSADHVAEIIQGGLQCRDEELRAVLAAAMAAANERRKREQAASAKTAAARKQPKQGKPVARAGSPTKAAAKKPTAKKKPVPSKSSVREKAPRRS